MAKSLKYIFLILLLGVISYFAYNFRHLIFGNATHVVENKEIILERMEKVNKLIAVEAYFSEVYDYKDYYYYDFSPLRKKALIRVKAKASIGYDFKNFEIGTNEETKTVTITHFPPPEILSLDHDLDYYDLTQGTFNSFTEADYNKINKNAKDFIKEKALDSKVLLEAESQKDELLEMFDWVLKSAGWSLHIVEKSDTKLVDIE